MTRVMKVVTKFSNLGYVMADNLDREAIVYSNLQLRAGESVVVKDGIVIGRVKETKHTVYEV